MQTYTATKANLPWNWPIDAVRAVQDILSAHIREHYRTRRAEERMADKVQITKSEMALVEHFRAMKREQTAELEALGAEVRAIVAKVEDISRYLCPGCVERLEKIVTFREMLKH